MNSTPSYSKRTFNIPPISFFSSLQLNTTHSHLYFEIASFDIRCSRDGFHPDETECYQPWHTILRSTYCLGRQHCLPWYLCHLFYISQSPLSQTRSISSSLLLHTPSSGFGFLYQDLTTLTLIPSNSHPPTVTPSPEPTALHPEQPVYARQPVVTLKLPPATFLPRSSESQTSLRCDEDDGLLSHYGRI